MICYIKGKIVFKDEKKIILLANDLGYEIFLSPESLKKAKAGTEEEIYTNLVLKEKEIEFYGFLSLKELDLFKELKSISGVGPKTALEFSSAGSMEKLKIKLETEKPPKGIGQKKLQKIILELTGKIKELDKGKLKEEKELVDALKSLGFSPKEMQDIILDIPEEITKFEEKIKFVLKNLNK